MPPEAGPNSEPDQPQPQPEPAAQPEPAPEPPAPEPPQPEPEPQPDLTQEVESLKSRLAELEPYANYGRQLAPYAEDIQTYLSQAGRQEPSDGEDDEWTPDKYFEEKWQSPQWDSQFDFAIQQGLVERDATGLWRAREGAESLVMGILPKLNEAESVRTRQWRDITQGNPYKIFYETLLEPMQRAWRKEINDALDERLADYESLKDVQRFEAENASWMYQTGPDGSQVPTEQGKKFLDTVAELRDAGMTDPDALIKVATRLVQGPASAPSSASEPPPEQASEEKKEAFLDSALDMAKHSPNSGGFTQQAPDEPVSVVNRGELNNMFTQAFRATQAQGR